MTADRVFDPDNVEHILGNAVPTDNILDIVMVATIHAENSKILLSDPTTMRYHQYFQHLHEDMILIMGFLQIAFDVTVCEAVEYAEKKAGNFHEAKIGKSIEEHYGCKVGGDKIG